MHRISVFIIFLITIMFMLSSCVVGPIRYKTVGFRKSATREMLKSENHWVQAGALAGPVIDVAIVLADTVWDPFIAFNLAGPHPLDESCPELKHVYVPFYSLGVRPRLDSDGSVPGIIMSTVFWTIFKFPFTPLYSYALLIEDEDAYRIYFGKSWHDS